MSPREPSGASKSQKAAFSKTLKNRQFFGVFGSRGLPREPQEAREGSQETPKELQNPQKRDPKLDPKINKFWINFEALLEPKMVPKTAPKKKPRLSIFFFLKFQTDHLYKPLKSSSETQNGPALLHKIQKRFTRETKMNPRGPS